jgi:hypothetical protein
MKANEVIINRRSVCIWKTREHEHVRQLTLRYIGRNDRYGRVTLA